MTPERYTLGVSVRSFLESPYRDSSMFNFNPRIDMSAFGLESVGSSTDFSC